MSPISRSFTLGLLLRAHRVCIAMLYMANNEPYCKLDTQEGLRPALAAYKTSDPTTTASIDATFLTSPSTSHLQSLPELLHHSPWLLEQIIGDVIVCGEPLTGWGRNLVHSASKHPKELDATPWKRRCQQSGSGIMCGQRCVIRSISG